MFTLLKIEVRLLCTIIIACHNAPVNGFDKSLRHKTAYVSEFWRLYMLNINVVDTLFKMLKNEYNGTKCIESSFTCPSTVLLNTAVNGPIALQSIFWNLTFCGKPSMPKDNSMLVYITRAHVSHWQMTNIHYLYHSLVAICSVFVKHSI